MKYQHHRVVTIRDRPAPQPKSELSISQRLLGDPPPGRSALDRKQQSTFQPIGDAAARVFAKLVKREAAE